MKKSLNLIGSVLAVIGIFFVGLRLHHYSSRLDFDKLTIATWSVIIGSALIYGMANCLLACTWRSLLKHFGVSTTWRWALRTYGISQLAKYMPGNVFHLAGRQSLGLAAELPGWPLAKSSVWEIGLISLTGGLFGLLALPLLLPSISVSFSLLLFSTVFFGVSVVLKYFSADMAKAFVCNLFFLTVSGMVFVYLLFQLSKIDGTHTIWVSFCGAYVIAWLVGLLTPGAPAGVGVREFVLLFLLKGFVIETELLLIIVTGRIVTVLGDIFFFFFALLVRVKSIK
ncbi:MAG: hypothetical protein J7L77_04345 [Clostridiales bacterium]|nr:hypothetical protein [Clostridiales bacterium]